VTRRTTPPETTTAVVVLEPLMRPAGGPGGIESAVCQDVSDELDGLPEPIPWAASLTAVLEQRTLLALLERGVALETLLPSVRRAEFSWEAASFEAYLHRLGCVDI
jgi:hypothetical protein